MPICSQCGGEIEIRHVRGKRVPIHVDGPCSLRDGGWVVRPYEPYEPRATYSYENTCRPSRCPRCRKDVFFIQHNSGSVWVNELGWPWPKHECFEPDKWYSYIITGANGLSDSRNSIAGVVVAARRLGDEEHGYYLGLAIDGGKGKRACVAIPGDATSKYYLGTIAVVHPESRKVVMSTHRTVELLPIDVVPAELGLESTWS